MSDRDEESERLYYNERDSLRVESPVGGHFDESQMYPVVSLY